METYPPSKGPCLYKGSVKNIYQDSQDDHVLFFQFTDDYSLFDWGKMPETIDRKGEALCTMASTLFHVLGQGTYWKPVVDFFLESSEDCEASFVQQGRQLVQSGLSHHGLPWDVSHSSSSWMKVQKVDVHRPVWESEKQNYHYQFFKTRPSFCLIPLEVIYRFGLPEGSSLYDRLEDKKFFPQGCPFPLDVGKKGKWVRPLLEWTTKLEPQDRFLTADEARDLAGMNEEEWSHWVMLNEWVAIFLRYYFGKMDLQLWDGKLEWAFSSHVIPGNVEPKRTFMLVDSIGPDEMRLLWHGHHLSKEMLRQFYKATDWGQKLAIMKAKYVRSEGRLWREDPSMVPPLLPPDLRQKCSLIYQKLCDDLCLSLGRPAVFQRETSDAIKDKETTWSDLLSWH
jgi:phosphoribosylaminoimidazole-succinocarboxamide synthase